MWKHIEQQSFHMSEDEYMEQLSAVADLIRLVSVTLSSQSHGNVRFP
jgi:hypothetical protein